MTAQEDLETTCKAMREKAEANCPTCHIERHLLHSSLPFVAFRDKPPDHTCSATIAAAERLALAAVGECNGINETCEKCLKRATIKRLLEEAK